MSDGPPTEDLGPGVGLTAIVDGDGIVTRVSIEWARRSGGGLPFVGTTSVGARVLDAPGVADERANLAQVLTGERATLTVGSPDGPQLHASALDGGGAALLISPGFDPDDRRFRAFVSRLPDAVWSTDDTGKVRLLNDAARTLGARVAAGTDVSRSWVRGIVPDDRAGVVEAFVRFLVSGEPLDVEYRTHGVEGAWDWIRCRSAMVYERGGRRIVEGIATDITAAKTLEGNLRRHARHAEQIANLARAAAEGRDEASLVRAAVEAVATALEVNDCAVFVDDGDPAGLRLQEGRGVCGVPGSRARRLSTGAALIADRADAEALALLPACVVAGGRTRGVRVPIHTAGGWYGTLDAYTGNDRRLDGDDVRALRAMAIVVGYAIERGRSDRRAIELADSMPGAWLITDSDDVVVLTNREAQRLFGHPLKGLVGRPVGRLIEGLGELEGAERRRAIATRADGTPVPVEVSIVALQAPGVWRRLVHVRDVSLDDRTSRLMEHLIAGAGGATGLRYLETLSSLLAEVLGVSIVSVGVPSADGKRVRTMATWMMGTLAPSAEFTLTSFPLVRAALEGELLWIPSGLQELAPHAPIVTLFESVGFAGVPLHAADGAVLGMLMVASRAPLPDDDGTRAMLRLASVRAAGELERIAADRLLRDAARRVQAAQEEERRRIARELHDELGHLLSGVKFDLAWLGRHLDAASAADRQTLAERFQSLEAHTDTTIATVRRLAGTLRPDILDDLGLFAAIEWLAHEHETRTGVSPGVAVDPELDAKLIGSARATALFRIAQEALTNVARHAEAGTVDISLEADGGNVVLSVTDDGRGVGADFVGGFGVRGMQERAELLGGRVTVAPGPRGGTRVLATIPPEDLER